MGYKMIAPILGLIVLILIGSLLYAKQSCTGLWERQPSKIPSDILSKTDGVANDYTTCVYIGFSGMIRKFQDGTTTTNRY
jgi:hypothetical protein